MAWSKDAQRPSRAGEHSVRAGMRLRARYGGSERGWLVVDGDGRQISTPPLRTEAAAVALAFELMAAANARAKRGPRPCLRCGAEFQSEGIHNRMCNGCRTQGDALGEPHRPYIAGR